MEWIGRIKSMGILKRHRVFLLAAIGGILLILAAAFLPGMAWRWDRVSAYLRGIMHPADAVPIVAEEEKTSSLDAWILAPVAGSTPLAPSSEESALPTSVKLTPPAFDWSKDIQDWNNCGPATLALALRMYGWKGDQFTVSAVIKPLQTDKNVSIDELASYVNTQTEDLRAAYRVDGSIELIKQFIYAGYPVIIEESFRLEQAFWPNDDLWAAHYLLVTGYDDNKSFLTVQDSFYGPNRVLPMSTLEQTWKPFNRLMMIVYPVDEEDKINKVWGTDWNVTENWNHALDTARAEIQENLKDAYAWFNLGSDLLALQKDAEASEAFSRARQLGLPQRMLRYQFGPLAAAYNTGNARDLIVLANFALDRTPNSEEALYWKGMAYLLTNQQDAARRSFERALEAHPGYEPALSALNLQK